jgi:hypothetical protein
MAQHGSAWLSMAQHGSAVEAMAQQGSAWLSMAQQWARTTAIEEAKHAIQFTKYNTRNKFRISLFNRHRWNNSADLA